MFSAFSDPATFRFFFTNNPQPCLDLPQSEWYEGQGRITDTKKNMFVLVKNVIVNEVALCARATE